MSDDYITITGTFKAARPKSVLLHIDDVRGPIFIPRSVMHGADERVCDEWAEGQEVTIRVREWFCEKEGLV